MNDTKVRFFLECKLTSLRRSPPTPIFDIGIQEPFLIYLCWQDSGQDSIDSIEKIKFHCYVKTFGYLECTAPPKIQALPLRYPSSSVCPAAQRDRCHDIRHLTLTPPWRTPAQYKTNKGVKFGSIAIWVHILLSVLYLYVMTEVDEKIQYPV